MSGAAVSGAAVSGAAVSGGLSALLLGATGETGKVVLSELLATEAVARIILVGRKIIDDIQDPHMKVVQRMVDFDQLEAKHAADFAEADLAYCCLGTTRAKAGKEGFVKVDHDYVVGAAKLLKASGCKDFHLLTAKGSDANSWFLYPQTKGRAEEAVKSLGFDRCSIYQPFLLVSDRAEPRMFEKVMVGIAKSVDKSHGWSVPVTTLGRAMVVNSLKKLEEGADKVEVIDHATITKIGKV